MDTGSDQPGLTDWLTLLGLGAIWGSVFMAMNLALDGFGPAARKAVMGLPMGSPSSGKTGEGGHDQKPRR